jgi:hypothetical protein
LADRRKIADKATSFAGKSAVVPALKEALDVSKMSTAGCHTPPVTFLFGSTTPYLRNRAAVLDERLRRLHIESGGAASTRIYRFAAVRASGFYWGHYVLDPFFACGCTDCKNFIAQQKLLCDLVSAALLGGSKFTI